MGFSACGLWAVSFGAWRGGSSERHDASNEKAVEPFVLDISSQSSFLDQSFELSFTSDLICQAIKRESTPLNPHPRRKSPDPETPIAGVQELYVQQR